MRDPTVPGCSIHQEAAEMIVEYIRYTIPEERSPAFLGAYQRAQAPMQQSPHCLSYELSRCTEDQQAYILRIQWDSLAGHLDGFRKSPEFQSFLAEIRPYVADIAEMRHYQVTDVCWSRAGQAR
jgi:quinol monooxygenase YgiN